METKSLKLCATFVKSRTYLQYYKCYIDSLLKLYYQTFDQKTFNTDTVVA